MGIPLKIPAVMARMDVKDPDTVYRLIKDGRLPAARLGRSFRVDSDDLERFMRGVDLREPEAGDETPPAKIRHEIRQASRRCRD